MDEIIYIVEDDEGIRELYEGAFEGVFLTKMFENGKDFFACFKNSRPSLIILDIMLPDMDGYTILTKIREMDEKIPVIIVSMMSRIIRLGRLFSNALKKSLPFSNIFVRNTPSNAPS